MQAETPCEPLLSPTDYRTKSPSSEKEMFHILPKLQAKRADFLTVMLTGSLHQRRTFTATPPETQNDGPRDDDVTKSESSSGASEKSTERSQDGAPSTLVADDAHKESKELGSVADLDPDQEEASNTIVLFSPGDTKKSPNALGKTEGDQGIVGSDILQHEKVDEVIWTGVQVQENIHHTETFTDTGQPNSNPVPIPKPGAHISTNPMASVSIASPPFSKVEQTFVHIAEISHQNIMSSSAAQIPEVSEEVMLQSKQIKDTHEPEEIATPLQPELIPFTEESQVLNVLHEEGTNIEDEPRKSIVQDFNIDSNQDKNLKNGHDKGDTVPVSKCHRPRSKSRIPILVPEDELGNEKSLSSKERLHRRALQKDLARQVVDRQRQGRWMRLSSRTSSSISSGDEPKRPSETLSATGSEEDILESDDSLNKLKKEAEEKCQAGWHSRIPRPVTPIRKPSNKLAVAAPLIQYESGVVKSEEKTPNGLKVQSQSGSSARLLHGRSKSTLSHPTMPSGTNRLPLSCIPASSRRSLSTTNCTFSSYRIASPSPHRLPFRTAIAESRKQPFPLRTTVEQPVNSRTNASGTSKDSKQSPNKATNAPVKNRTKASAQSKKMVSVKREKSTSNNQAAAR
ncbi:hypothetical protein DNTS_017198 [Danionella cerebrum]|uniref:Tau-tubulin kinase 1 n=1 Tax=Danionella cerebrum TaxID=2873325 RepID=A0A553QBX5_9TELE|nr:hypothetical protein DNTS_017198 [Danionella translucida]